MKDVVARHTIQQNRPVREALIKLDHIAPDSILFVVDEEIRLLGSLTDGDLRRGFIKGLDFTTPLMDFVQPKPAYLLENEIDLSRIEEYRNEDFKVLPIVDSETIIKDIFLFRKQQTLIPADAVLMAGGEGKRLRPLTEHTPKPLLKVGDKPIIEYNIDRLINFGIKKISLSINYLGDQLVEYFGNGESKNIEIAYVKETKPLGTIGSILLIDGFKHDDIIVMNSDLLTNIDFYDFYKVYKEAKADMAVAATSYSVDIPYGVLETGDGLEVKAIKEKPKYTYYSNAGIYIIKKSLVDMIPKDSFFNITDLMEKVLSMNLKLINYPINGYWLDIGKHDDFKKAQEDIKHIKF